MPVVTAVAAAIIQEDLFEESDLDVTPERCFVVPGIRTQMFLITRSNRGCIRYGCQNRCPFEAWDEEEEKEDITNDTFRRRSMGVSRCDGVEFYMRILSPNENLRTCREAHREKTLFQIRHLRGELFEGGLGHNGVIALEEKIFSPKFHISRGGRRRDEISRKEDMRDGKE